MTALGPSPRKLAAWTALPLAGNALLYLAYRDSSLWCFRWVEAGGMSAPVAGLRRVATGLGDPGEFVRFSLASGLWILGVMSFLLLTWQRVGAGRGLFAWAAGILGLCLGSEVAQAAGWIPGTADLGDALAYLAGTAVAFLTHHRPARSERSVPAGMAHVASLALVTGAMLLATGAIYAGAMGELRERWLPDDRPGELAALSVEVERLSR